MARGVEQVHRHLPVARIAIMPGQRHVAIDTAPELFASLVRDFLAG
jgi:pimeloyl-ACP methyl ester carboxylesterase